MAKLIDISPLISEKIAVFPGDIQFTRRISMDMKKGDHLTLSSIETTLHLGAHADGPNHYQKNGSGIHERDLNLYWGLCQVFHAKARSDFRIYPQDLNLNVRAARVLFRTDSFENPNQWHNDFSALSPELIDYLAREGVELVGIDTPSIDPATSKDLPSHAAVARCDMAVLEGLVLSNVDEGLYELCALPLKLKDCDAAPVRAVLKPLD